MKIDPQVSTARRMVFESLREGCFCPTCGQKCKEYPRKIHSTMAKTLITMYWASRPGEFIHVPSLPGDTHEASQLVWWELIEEELRVREDGGRAGYWRLTPMGRSFVLGRAKVPQTAWVYDGKVRSLSGGFVSIHDCLGDKFNYAELMTRTA